MVYIPLFVVFCFFFILHLISSRKVPQIVLTFILRNTHTCVFKDYFSFGFLSLLGITTKPNKLCIKLQVKYGKCLTSICNSLRCIVAYSKIPSILSIILKQSPLCGLMKLNLLQKMLLLKIFFHNGV